MKILIVDDNNNMRAIIRTIVEELGHTVCECNSGNAALAIYNRCHPDAVLMDIEMKNGDGITATRNIKHSDPDAKIIIVTQYNDNELREEATKAGAENFFLKENLLDVRDTLIKIAKQTNYPKM